MPVVRDDVEAYHGDQIVVEQRDTGLVRDHLRQLGAATEELDANASLRLGLLGLPDVTAAAAGLRRDGALVQAADQDRVARGVRSAAGVGDLDLVLFALRRGMRRAYDGWSATVGKNRVVDQVEAAPYIKGGVGYPTPAGPPGPADPPVAGTAGAGARVAILDTRFVAHRDLAGRYVGDVAVEAGPSPRSTQGHSTFIAGLVIRQAPAAEVVVRTVLDDDGLNASSWDVAASMVAVLAADVDVLNLSLGCATGDGTPPLCLTRAVERLLPSVVVVAAAGNVGVGGQKAGPSLTPATPQFPAAIDGVVGVGAYDGTGGSPRPAVFSPGAPWVSLHAPGVEVLSTFLAGDVRRMRWDGYGHLVEHDTVTFPAPGYARWSGTSFAAGTVSGLIAAGVEVGHVSAYEALERLQRSGSEGLRSGAAPVITRFPSMS